MKQNRDYYDTQTIIAINRVLAYLNKIEVLGFDMSNYKNIVNSVYNKLDNRLNGYELFTMIKFLDKNYLSKYHNIVSIKDLFSNLRKELDYYDISFSVDSIIESLENLKNDDLFLDDRITNFIKDIYEVCYLYMKLEFLYNNSSKLFNYFNESYHDFWYINEFLKLDIEFIINSVNYIDGLEELKKLIDDRSDKRHFMYENIIKRVSFSMYGDVYKDYCSGKTYNFGKRFNSIYREINRILDWFSSDSKVVKDKFKELREQYKIINNEYEEFINSVKYHDLETMGKINDLCLTISKHLGGSNEE